MLIIDKGYKVECLNIRQSQVWLGLCAVQEALGTPLMHRTEDTYEQRRAS